MTVPRRSTLLAALVLVLLPVAPASAMQLPPGFTHANYAYMPGATSLDFAPDGSLFIISDDNTNEVGIVWRYDEVNGLRQIGQIDCDTFASKGLQSIKVDPDFETNGHIWIYYTAKTPEVDNRLSRFTVVGETIQDEVVIFDGPPIETIYHHGGCFDFDSYGNIYLAPGDDARGSNTAQNPFDIRGKVLRMDRAGNPPPDNPWADGVDAHPLVWALGLRNPFRCRMQPGLDNLFIGDVGEGAWEEIDIGIAGANYGWAEIEGPEPPGVPGYVYPIHSYPHDNPDGNAVIIGDFAGDGDFVPEYLGNLFYADYSARDIRRMVLNEQNEVVEWEVWATEVSQPVDMTFGPDGALYVANQSGGFFEGGIQRIEYVGGANRQPTAALVVTPDSGLAPLDTTLDASGSTDPDDDPLTFDWDLGDGTTIPDGGPTLNHTYAQGVWTATVTVSDGNGGTSVRDARIVVGNLAPTATITDPAAGTTYDAGDTIAYAGTGTDPEDGTLGCGAFTWQVVFHHAGHTHPFLGPEAGACSGTFTVPDRGETAANVFYRINLTVEDSGAPLGADAALTGSDVRDILPNTSLMTFETLPNPNLDLAIDTQPFTAPSTIEGVVNFIREIGAIDGQERDGRRWTWLTWSDGGARIHEIRTPATPTTYTALYGCNVIEEASGLTLDRNGTDLTLTWDPVVDDCLTTEPERYRIYAATSATPTSPPGSWPTDPEFRLVGTSSTTSFTYAPGPDDRYFVVVAVGTDLLDGAVGHYGQ